MRVTADFLIDRRKRQWKVHHDIKKDEKFVLAVAFEIIRNKFLREEIIDNPEKLIDSKISDFVLINFKFYENIYKIIKSNKSIYNFS